MSTFSLRMTDYHQIGVVRVCDPFLNFWAVMSLEQVNLGTSNMVCKNCILTLTSGNACMIDYS